MTTVSMPCLYQLLILSLWWKISAADVIEDEYHLNVTSSGPAVSGSIVTFQATLFIGTSKARQDEKLFNYEWNSTVDQLTKTQLADYNTSLDQCFDSFVQPGKYYMAVSVYSLKSWTWFKPVARKVLEFNITQSMNGNLQQNQTIHRSSGVDNSTCVTYKPIDFIANLTDLFKYTPNFTYIWYVDNKLYDAGDSKNKSIKFGEAGNHTVRLDVVSTGTTSDCKNYLFRQDLKGVFHTDLVLKDAVTDITLYGKKDILFGENMTLTAVFNGSAPYTFCWRLVALDGHSLDVNISCVSVMFTPTSTIHLSSKNLSRAGRYSLSIRIENDVSTLSRQHYLMVHAVPAPQPSNHSAAVILIPVMFVLLAITVLLFGGMFYVKYRRNRVHHIESADFVFHESIQTRPSKGWFQFNVKETLQNILRTCNSSRGWDQIDADKSGQTRQYGTMVNPVEA